MFPFLTLLWSWDSCWNMSKDEHFPIVSFVWWAFYIASGFCWHTLYIASLSPPWEWRGGGERGFISQQTSKLIPSCRFSLSLEHCSVCLPRKIVIHNVGIFYRVEVGVALKAVLPRYRKWKKLKSFIFFKCFPAPVACFQLIDSSEGWRLVDVDFFPDCFSPQNISRERSRKL